MGQFIHCINMNQRNLIINVASQYIEPTNAFPSSRTILMLRGRTSTLLLYESGFFTIYDSYFILIYFEQVDIYSLLFLVVV